MNVQDKVSKAVWNLVQGIKDQVNANLVSAAASKKIKVEQPVLTQIISLINQSIDQSYHGGLKTVVVEAIAVQQQTPKVKR